MNNIKKFRREFGRELTNSNLSQNNGTRKSVSNRPKMIPAAKIDASIGLIRKPDSSIEDSRNHY
jgi:hypothetical protein